MQGARGFIGLIFFDLLCSHAFTQTMQRDLLANSTLINLAVSSELAAIASIIASAHMARKFANLRDFDKVVDNFKLAHMPDTNVDPE
jgi:hypothetical protein